MAQVLLAKKDEADKKKGDIVDTFEHDKWFPQNIYDTFDVLPVPGFTKAEIDAEFLQKMPERVRAWKSKTTEWTLVVPEEKDLWKSETNEWYFLEEEPGLGYGVSLGKISAETRASLESEEVDVSIKRVLIADNAFETISRDAANLNKVDKLVEA